MKKELNKINEIRKLYNDLEIEVTAKNRDQQKINDILLMIHLKSNDIREDLYICVIDLPF